MTERNPNCWKDGPHGRTGRGHVPHRWRSPTTRTASSCPPRTRKWSKTASTSKASCGFTFGNGCSGGTSEAPCSASKPQGSVVFADMPKSRKQGGHTVMKERTTMSLYPILATLLEYPEAELLGAMPDIEDALSPIPRPRGNCARSSRRLNCHSLIELQETYVATFDRNPAPLAASLRACAWRKPRSRAGHGRPARRVPQSRSRPGDR